MIEASEAQSVEDRANAHRALADPVRVAIVDRLSIGDRAPTDLGQSLGLASNLAAHHLRILVRHGVISARSQLARRRSHSRPSAEALIVRMCDQAREEIADHRVPLHWSVPDPVAIGTDHAFEAVADDSNG